ncbi:MAG: hypothetical protein JNL11_06600 [Bdellovibrionaceae bacterium]|nr:hypothetical protein [Pseudobdellovibrionaceae bacterium]
MKTALASIILLISSSFALASENSRRYEVYRGRIGVGTPRGAICELLILSSGRDFNGTSFYKTKLAKGTRLTNKGELIPMFEQEFDLFQHGSTLQGSARLVTKKGIPLKGTVSFFTDPRSNLYKAILHENTLNSSSSVGRFTVCDNMALAKVADSE